MTEFSRILAFTTGIFGLSAAPVSAADVPLKAPAPPAAIVMNWSGGYLGLHGGWLWARHSATFPGGNPALQVVGVPGLGFETDENAGIAGAHFGYQHQFGNLVIGAELGITALIGSHTTRTLCPKQTIALFGCSARFRDVIFTAGGRAGWSMGNWLPYVAGGYAVTRFYADALNVSLAPVGARIVWWDDRTDGWYIGGGLDWAFAQGVSLGIEYRHYDFSKTTTGRAIIGGVPGVLPNDAANFKTTADSLTVRLTYRFGAAPI